MARKTPEAQVSTYEQQKLDLDKKLIEARKLARAAAADRRKQMHLAAGAAVVDELEENPEGVLAKMLIGLLTDRVSKTNLKNLFGIEKGEGTETKKAAAEPMSSAA